MQCTDMCHDSQTTERLIGMSLQRARWLLPYQKKIEFLCII
jgi:hypothetical protein